MNQNQIVGGSVRLLRLFDVANSIDLEQARLSCGQRGARRGAAVVRGPDKALGGVALGTEPLDMDVGSVELEGFSFSVQVRLFDFGVASLRFEMALRPGMSVDELLELSEKLEQLTSLDGKAREVWNTLSAELRSALREEHLVDFFEDYTIFHTLGVVGVEDAKQALEALEPAKLLLAEPQKPLATGVIEAHQKRAIQYYASDATVVGWSAALIVDPDASNDEVEVLEVATARRLELRYYDELLSRELAGLYRASHSARKASNLFRSPFVGVARRAAMLFIEIADLYDHFESALTLLGDTYTARLYREASERFRLDELSAAVKEKLGTLSRVSEIFEAEVGHKRTTLLEVAVVALIVLEVVLGILNTHS